MVAECSLFVDCRNMVHQLKSFSLLASASMRPQEAKAYYEKALKILPNNPKILTEAGETQFAPQVAQAQSGVSIIIPLYYYIIISLYNYKVPLRLARSTGSSSWSFSAR